VAKTYQDLINEARVLLQDTDSDGYRYSNEVLLAKLNRGLQELGRVRPDAFWNRFIGDDILVPEVVAVDADPDLDPDEVDLTEDAEVALSSNFDIPMQFYGPLVYFVTASAEIVDDEFSTDGRASMLLAQFKAQLVSV
jgi:hypothetical protein